MLLPGFRDNHHMSSAVNVTIHTSQFPEAVQRDLLASLRTRRVNHKFHYDSVKQTQKWLALHQAYSPSRNSRDVSSTYDRAFARAAAMMKSRRVHVIGLGCGGGQKDTRLLRLLKQSRREIFYTPSDVSVAMTLLARQTAQSVVSEKNCFPLVCDLATAGDLTAAIGSGPPAGAVRLVTFFGMIPNFEPEQILPKLAAVIRPGDFLLFSANLAPGKNYSAGINKVLPQYDNALTRDWLLGFLSGLGVARADGRLRFSVEPDADGRDLKKIVARFHFKKPSRIQIEDEAFRFRAGDAIQLFFSYRYTSGRVRQTLEEFGLEVLDEWIAKSTEEGVFLCCHSP